MGKKRRCGDGDGDDDHHHLPLLLPEDFFIQILVCLPVTSLLRFKSVCKSWRDLIDSSFFIDLHTNTTSKFGTFIVQTYSGREIKMYTISSGSGGGGGGGGGEDDNNDEDDDQKKKKKMVLKVDDLGFLPFYKDFLLTDTLRMVGSCNGIICLHDPQLMDDPKEAEENNIIHISGMFVSLWNPATRQFRILPKSIPIKEKQYYMGNWLEDLVVFGFDVKTKDYKVLRITHWGRSEEGGRMCRVQVYSLSTDSWRLLEGINSLPAILLFIDQHQGIYLNGRHFFVGRKFDTDGRIRDSMLLSFDFTKEIFTTMQLPEDVITHNMVLSYLGEKLALFTFRFNCDVDIWVLNEQHGSCPGGGGLANKESWTKLHSHYWLRMKTRRGGPHYSEPRCISNNGEFTLILTDDGYGRPKLQLFNLVTKEANKKYFTIGSMLFRADVYKESLVSIMGGGNVLLRWQLLPTYGTTCYKLNLDAPFIDSNFSFGIGLCLTSDTGGCIRVGSLQRYVRDAEEGEALAILEAIKWAKKLELSPIYNVRGETLN